jgi:hypothetical protein
LSSNDFTERSGSMSCYVVPYLTIANESTAIPRKTKLTTIAARARSAPPCPVRLICDRATNPVIRVIGEMTAPKSTTKASEILARVFDLESATASVSGGGAVEVCGGGACGDWIAGAAGCADGGRDINGRSTSVFLTASAAGPEDGAREISGRCGSTFLIAPVAGGRDINGRRTSVFLFTSAAS